MMCAYGSYQVGLCEVLKSANVVQYVSRFFSSPLLAWLLRLHLFKPIKLQHPFQPLPFLFSTFQ